MRRPLNTRIAAVASAFVAGVFAAYMLRGGASSQSAAPVRQQPAEVRTQVIRRTIHIVRHERPLTRRAPSGAASPRGSAVPAASVTAPRTTASGAHGVAPSTSLAPRTRTSAAGGSGSGSPTTVRTRTSGGGGNGDGSGSHDD